MPNVDVIIVGYGSAGKRHEFAARSLQMSVVTVDPDHTRNALMYDYEHAFRAYKPNMVVIASPPDTHLEIIEAALQVTPYVLCEKPLSGFGQVEWAQGIVDAYPWQQVNVAYNYRYHRNVKRHIAMGDKFSNYRMVCSQYRPIKPQWGFLLDHISHDLDILRVIVGHNIEITDAMHLHTRDAEKWVVTARAGNIAISIEDAVTNKPSDRIAGIQCGNGDPHGGMFIDIDADPSMYEIMWSRFVRAADTKDNVDVSISDALVTQKLLDTVYGDVYHEFDE